MKDLQRDDQAWHHEAFGYMELGVAMISTHNCFMFVLKLASSLFTASTTDVIETLKQPRRNPPVRSVWQAQMAEVPLKLSGHCDRVLPKRAPRQHSTARRVAAFISVAGER